MIKLIIVIGALIGFFIILWGSTYLFHNRSQKIMTWVIGGTSLLVLAQSVYGLLLTIAYSQQTFAFGQSLEGVSNSIGISGFLWGLTAVFILFSKRLFCRLRLKRVRDGDLVLVGTRSAYLSFLPR